MPDNYYSDKLYPIQDEVLGEMQSLKTGFYLTGGTALGRCYSNHRYSDNLDFFVNAAPDFKEQFKTILDRLEKMPCAARVSISDIAEDILNGRIILETIPSFTQKLSGLTRQTIGTTPEAVDTFIDNEREERFND
jgi:hypothetical protein